MRTWGKMLTALILTAALCLGAAAGCAQGVLTLPSAVKEIQAEAFAGAEGFAEIVLPEGVETIGERAFAESSIERIRIPDGVTSIGTGAFYNCVDLVSADVSDGVTEIADYLFWRCLKLEEVNIPAGVTRIGGHAFSACIALPEIEIPDSVTEIGEYAFSECAALTQLTIPGSVKSIGQMAFYSCLDLETVVLEEGVESIADNAFFYCPYLTRAVIPASVTSIGMRAFGDCDELTIYGETGSYAQTYAAEHSIPFISEEEAAFEYNVISGEAWVTGYTGSKTNVVVPETLGGYPVTKLERTFDSNRTLETVVLPSTLEKVGEYAFWGCESLTSVEFNSDVTEIGEWAFFQCRVLEDFMLPESVTSIGRKAFSGCRALTKLPFGGHVKTIGAYAFEECWGFTGVDIPDGVETISANAFSNGQYLKNIVIPASVTSIGANAFSGSLYDMTIYGYTGSAAETYAANNDIQFIALDGEETSEFTYATNEMGTFVTGYTGTATTLVVPAMIDGVKMDGVWHNAFKENTLITSVTLQDGLKSIGGEAFRGCTALERVTLPQSVQAINSSAFRECTALRTIELPDNATLGWGAFYGCSSLNSVTLPANLTALPAYAFRECSLLISAPIPAGVTEIGEYAFFECINLRGVEIPAGVTEIGEHAFDNCEMIDEIILPETLQTLGGYAFYSCASLTGVEFNSDITEIGEFTFFQCGNLKDIQLPASVTSIGASAFTGCNGLTALPFGEGVETIGERAFADCYYLAEVEIPSTVTSIGRQAFAFCYDLTKATIPATVTEIGEMAFWNNDESFTIYGYTGSAAQTYATENSIAFVALDGGESTPDEPDDPEIEETPATSFNYTINDGEATILQFIGSETQVVIPAKIEDCPVTRVNSGAFYGQAVTSVVFPESVWEIGEYCFSLCDYLESVTITAATENIGANILNECPKASIVGVENSYAHLYAQRWNIPFTANGSLPARTSEYYLTTDGNEATVLFYSGSMTDLVIPDVIDGYTITGIGNYAFTDVNGLTKVTLPSTLKVIGKHAFSYTGLQEIEIPDGVFNIGPNAFRECYSLTKATIPASVTNITSSAFRDCGDGFTIYGYTSSAAETYATEQNYLFVALDGGENPDDPEIEETPATSFEYTIADGEVTIEAFTGSETDIVVPKTIEGYPVTTIGNSAFHGCKAKSIVVQSSVTTLAGFSFTWCDQLETITIPASVTNIGDNLFLQSNSALVIIGEAGSAAEAAAQKYAVDFKDAATGDITYNDDYGYVIADGQATVTAYSGTETVLVVPGELGGCPVTAIGSSALMNDSDVTSITIPEGVTSIGVCAMQYNYRLTEVILPESLTRIGAYAFRECESLQEITIPAGVTRIGENAFEAVAEGFTIYGYAGSTAETYAAENGIPFVALDGGTDEPEVTDYVYTITDGEAAITGYNGSEASLVIPAELEGCPVTRIEQLAFFGRGVFTDIVIPDGVTYIGAQAFSFCDSLTSITIPASVTEIADNTFLRSHYALIITGEKDSAAEAFALAYGVGFRDAQTGEVLFDNDYGYVINNGKVRINAYTGIETELVVPAEIAGYPVGELFSCMLEFNDDVVSLTVPSSVTTINGSMAFSCVNLKEVHLSEGLKYIFNGAFQGCTSLTEIEIPSTVTYIGGEAFKGCSALTRVVIPSAQTEIGADVFADTAEGFTIYGTEGGYAQSYAAENNIAFVVLGSEEPETPEYTYVIDYNFTARITGYTGTDTELVLPSELGGYPVTTVGDSAFENRTELVKVTLPETLTKIATSAFAGCTSLGNVTIPAGVKEIGDSAFYNCSAMTEIVIPDSVTTVGGFAFSCCYNLTKAVIPASVTSIGVRAFFETPAAFEIHGYSGSAAQTYAAENSHTFVVLNAGEEPADPEGEQTEGDYTYIVADGKATIVSYAGSDMEVTIPAALGGYPVETIGEYAFEAKTMTAVIIPEGVTTIDKAAFDGCPSTLTIYGAAGSCAETYASENGHAFVALDAGEEPADPEGEQTEGNYTYTVADGKATIVSYAGSDMEVTIPAALGGYPVVQLSMHAFSSNETLRTVTIPEGVKSIQMSAFLGCTNLTSVSIPDSVTEIGGKVFSQCSSLTSVNLPSGLTAIGSGLFEGCSALESIDIPAGVVSIGEAAFYACNSLKSVDIPAGVVSIGGNAFANCWVLSNVSIPLGVTRIEDYAFYACDGLTEISIPQSVTYIAGHAFEACDGLTEITIPENVQSVGDYAFYGCTKLDSVTIENPAMVFGANAFDYFYKLTIYGYTGSTAQTYAQANGAAFVAMDGGSEEPDVPVVPPAEEPEFDYFCDGYTVTIDGYNGSSANVVIPATIEGCPVTELSNNAFQFNTTMTSVVIPDSVELIGDYCFDGCEALETVILGSGLKQIGMSAFSGCSALSQITLPEGLEMIGEAAFISAGLTEVNVPASVYQLGANAFRYNYAMTEATIKGDVGYLGDFMFIGNTALRKVTIEGNVGAFGEMAFGSCSALEEITIPASVTSIADNAFSGAAEDFTIYGYYGSYAQTYAVTNGYPFIALDEGPVTPEEPEEPIESFYTNGYTYILENGNAVLVGYNGEETKPVVPQTLGGYTVVEIRERTFKGTAITEITLPESLTSIGTYVFEDCSQLYRVKVLSKTVVFDDMTFGGTSDNLTILCYSDSTALAHALEMGIPYSILDGIDGTYTDGDWSWTIENGETTITKYTGTAQEIYLTEMIEGSPIVAIGEEAFASNGTLVKIVLPETVLAIEEKAFYGCAKLEEIVFPANLKTIGATAFRQCYVLEEALLPDTVTSIGDDAFEGCFALHRVSLPQGLQTIGYRVFGSCTSLTSVTIPASVTSIGSSAFEYTALTEISIPGSVTSIGEGAYASCTALTEVTIPDTVVNLGSRVFENCYGLKKVVIGRGVTEIPDKLVYGCRELTQLSMPDTITKIGKQAIQDTKLTSLILPDSVTEIGELAFHFCEKLESVTIPASVTQIADNAFSGVAENFTIYGYAGSYAQTYAQENGYSFVILEDSELTENGYTYEVKNGKATITKYTGNHVNPTLPAQLGGYPVTAVGAGAFSGVYLEKVVIPEGITVLGDRVFENCASLNKIVIPRSVVSIGEGIFDGCVYVAIYGYTGSYAQTYAQEKGMAFSALDAESTPGEATQDYTPASSFYYKILDEEVYITQYSAEEEAEEVRIPPQIDGFPVVSVFGFMDDDITRVEVPYTVRRIEEQAFSNCKNLQSISLQKGLKEICNHAFEGCSALVSLDIPEGVEIIGSGAFSDCTALESLTFGNGLVSVGTFAFNGCDALKNVVFLEGVQEIGTEAFCACNALESVTIPASVTVIGSDVFLGVAEGFTIYGYAGTTAETYAAANGLVFVTLDVQQPETALTAICPWSAGSVSDSALRAFGSALVNEAGVGEVTYSNLTGAGGVIGHQAIADAAADGKTLGMITTELSMYAPMNTASLTYASVDPLCILGINEASVLVNAQWAASNGITDMSSFIAYCTANPASVRMAVSSAGSVWHMAGGYLEKKTGVDLSLMNYADGAATSIQNAALGMEHGVVTSLPNAAPFINSGDLICLGVMGTKRNDFFPTYETCSEQGYALVYGAWYGIAAPKGLDASMKAALEACCKTAAQSESFASAMAEIGFNLTYMGANEAVQFLSQNYTDTYEVITALGL